MSRGSTRNAYHGGEGALLGSCEGRQRFETLLGGTGFQHEGSLMAGTPTASHISFPFFEPFYPVYIPDCFFFGHSIFKGRLGTGIYHSYNESRKIGAEEELGGIIKLLLALGGTVNQTKHTPTTLLLFRCYDFFIMREVAGFAGRGWEAVCFVVAVPGLRNVCV